MRWLNENIEGCPTYMISCVDIHSLTLHQPSNISNISTLHSNNQLTVLNCFDQLRFIAIGELLGNCLQCCLAILQHIHCVMPRCHEIIISHGRVGRASFTADISAPYFINHATISPALSKPQLKIKCNARCPRCTRNDMCTVSHQMMASLTASFVSTFAPLSTRYSTTGK